MYYIYIYIYYIYTLLHITYKDPKYKKKIKKLLKYLQVDTLIN